MRLIDIITRTNEYENKYCEGINSINFSETFAVAPKCVCQNFVSDLQI